MNANSVIANKQSIIVAAIVCRTLTLHIQMKKGVVFISNKSIIYFIHSRIDIVKFSMW